MLAEVDPSWLRTRGPGRSALRAPDVVGHSPTLIGQVDLAFTVAVSLCDPYAAESLAHTVRVVYIVNRTYGQSPAMGGPDGTVRYAIAGYPARHCCAVAADNRVLAPAERVAR